MKKFALIACALALICSTVFSNGQQDVKDEKVVLSILAYGDNSSPEGTSFVRIVKSFEEKYPNIDIEYELLANDPFHEKVVARLAANDIPDIACMGADAKWGMPWKEAGQQYDHRDLLGIQYDQTLIPPMGPNGEIYEIPVGVSNITSVLFMNEKLVKSLGFEKPETYEDIKAMVPAAKAAGLEVVSIDGADGWAWGSCLLSAFVGRTTGNISWVSEAVEGKHKFTDPDFVNALKLIEILVADGVISKKTILTDYGGNIANFNNEKALFMVQGQWAANGIENPEVADNTVLMAWPQMPFEKSTTAGCVAGAITTGYGLTKKGASDPKVKAAALTFFDYFYSEEESTQRMIDGSIIAPILTGFKAPADLSNIAKNKIELSRTAMTSNVIDAFLTGSPNDALNTGMQKIVSGQATAEEVAAEVEKLLR